MPLAGIGAGAAEGLETLLARHRAEEVLAQRRDAQTEQMRSNQAEEVLRGRQIDMMGQARQDAMAQQALVQAQREEDRQRDDLRAQLPLIPMGTEMTPERRQQFLDAGATGPEMFTEEAGGAPLPGDDQGPTQRIVYGGTARQRQVEDQAAAQAEYRKQQQAQHEGDSQRRSDQDAFRREIDLARLALAREHEGRLASYGPPVIQIADPNAPGGASIVPRATAMQAGGAPVPPTGAQRGELAKNETAEAQLQRLNEMFEGGAKRLVGPMEGRLRVLGQQVPGLPTNDQFSDFSAATAAFKSAVIQRVTGAALGVKEERRILSQVPLESDKPEVWKAKYRQSLANIRDLDRVLSQGRGQRAAAPASSATPAKAPLTSGRFTIEVE